MTENEIRAAAIKEFAERLWDKLVNYAEVTYGLPRGLCVDVFNKDETAKAIDEIIKEMTRKDNMRAQLIELLDQNFGCTRETSAVEMADYLIENGVTIIKNDIGD